MVGFEDRTVLLMPLGEMQGVGLGTKVTLFRLRPRVRIGSELLGRIIDGIGEPLDNKGPIITSKDADLMLR